MSKSVLHQILDRAGFSPVTKSKYTLVIDRWITFAGTDPKSWTRDKAQEFYDQLLVDGIKPQSANIYIASLRYVSKWYATKTGAVDFAVVQRRRNKVRKEQTEDNAPILSEAEARKLLLSCQSEDGSISPLDRRDRAFFVLALETGMRRMSFVGATFEGINKRRGYPSIKVPIKGSGGEETFDVPLSDTAVLMLEDWLDWLRKHGHKKGEIFRRLSAQTTNRGREYVADSVLSLTGINEIVAKRADAAGLRHVNPHMLRHTFISWRSMAGLSPLDISEITGHKVSTIVVDGLQMSVGGMRTYFHRDVEKIRNSTPAWLAQLVGGLVRG